MRKRAGLLTHCLRHRSDSVTYRHNGCPARSVQNFPVIRRVEKASFTSDSFGISFTEAARKKRVCHALALLF